MHNFHSLILSKKLAVFWLACGAFIESDIFNFETLLNNFTSFSTISPNFRTTHPVVTENSSRQNLGGKKKKWKKKQKKRIIIILQNYISVSIISKKNTTEQSLRWLVRKSPDKISAVFGTPMGQP